MFGMGSNSTSGALFSPGGGVGVQVRVRLQGFEGFVRERGGWLVGRVFFGLEFGGEGGAFGFGFGLGFGFGFRVAPARTCPSGWGSRVRGERGASSVRVHVARMPMTTVTTTRTTTPRTIMLLKIPSYEINTHIIFIYEKSIQILN